MSTPSPIHSMTGFGAGHADLGDRRLAVELRTVNHRQLKLNVRTGRELAGQEARIEALLRKGLERGAVSASLSLEGGRTRAIPTIDEEALRTHRDTLRAAAEPLGLWLPARQDELALLLTLPGVFADPDALEPASGEALEAALDEATQAALRDLSAARAAEGTRLADTLRRELASLRSFRQTAAERASTRASDARDRWLDRLRSLLAGLGPESPRLSESDLLREIALLADRLDVTEEIDRLAAHLDRFEELLAAGGPVGRALDFLCQELLREVNTIGSKAADDVLQHAVVDAKCDIERLKEQVQNLE